MTSGFDSGFDAGFGVVAAGAESVHAVGGVGTLAVAFGPPRVYVHSGDGRRIAELVDAAVKRSYRTMQVSRAICVIPETDPQLALCDPREGRLLVIESSAFPLIWAGPISSLEGGPVAGTVQIEARSYEAVLQERYLPTECAIDGTSGFVFEALHAAVEAENPTGVSLSRDIAAGQPFDQTVYSDRSLFDAWTLVAQQTGQEWWLEHEMGDDVLQTQAHFRPARGQDRTTDVQLMVGPWANVRVNRWRISVEGAQHRIRGVAGATSATEAYGDRVRVERRLGKAPVSTAQLVQAQNMRHGYDFGKWPTGDTVLTRGERLAILENVRGAGALAIAAEATLLKGRTAQRAVDIALQAAPELWQFCTPGDVVRLNLPAPYFIDGIDTPVAILDVEVSEEDGTLRMTCEVPAA